MFQPEGLARASATSPPPFHPPPSTPGACDARGYGSNTWPDGTVYHGSWRENCPSGHGEYSLNGGAGTRARERAHIARELGAESWVGNGARGVGGSASLDEQRE